jgi:hypothetical protein
MLVSGGYYSNELIRELYYMRNACTFFVSDDFREIQMLTRIVTYMITSLACQSSYLYMGISLITTAFVFSYHQPDHYKL